ncbi:MAG: ATP-binding protein, partial [Bacteroidales bacterium]|nr:ATP-binding protein [Bacteroidales bacterium]
NKSNDLLNIFNKVIDISVIQSKKLSLINTEFSPKIMLEEIYNNYIQKIPSQESNAELHLDIDIDSYDFTIYSDPIRLKQILSYLLNNAIKYTEQGSINFGYRKKENHLEFFVKDTGIGIPDDQLSNLFTRFKKIERDKEKLYRGTGLGLSISKDLIELMGGRIFVESKTGVGTTFYFTIPISIK